MSEFQRDKKNVIDRMFRILTLWRLHWEELEREKGVWCALLILVSCGFKVLWHGIVLTPLIPFLRNEMTVTLFNQIVNKLSTVLVEENIGGAYAA